MDMGCADPAFAGERPRLALPWSYSKRRFGLLATDSVCLLGIRTKKALPLPSSLSTQIRPSCSSTRFLVIESPNPVPPNFLLIPSSTWRKLSKIFS